jgi:hypothetical protein
MALDPRIRAELERRGPANVRGLLRTRTGPGDRDPVALQLAGVPDPPRSEVEDWLREGEREGETVTRDTLKWAKIAGRAAVIGVVVTAIVGIVGVIIGVRSCSYSSSTYNEQNRPILTTLNYRADPNDVFVWTLSNRGNEDATDIHFKFAGIDQDKKSATALKPESPAIWPRLVKFQQNLGEVRIQVSTAKFAYLLVCQLYERARSAVPSRG